MTGDEAVELLSQGGSLEGRGGKMNEADEEAAKRRGELRVIDGMPDRARSTRRWRHPRRRARAGGSERRTLRWTRAPATARPVRDGGRPARAASLRRQRRLPAGPRLRLLERQAADRVRSTPSRAAFEELIRGEMPVLCALVMALQRAARRSMLVIDE